MKKTRKYALLAVVLTAAMVFTTTMGAVLTQAADADPNYEPESAINYDDFGYQVNEDGTATITEYTGSTEDLIIPSEIDGYPVSAIGPETFSYQKLKSLTIPEGVGEIGNRAFEYCTVSGSLVLPKNILIHNDAFSYAKLPEVVTIPEGAVLQGTSFSYITITKLVILEPGVVVEEDAFSYTKALELVVCGPNVTLENEAFNSSYNLAEVVLCGDVTISGDPFFACENVEVNQAEEDEFGSVLAELREKAEEFAGLTKYTDGKMTFYLPQGMISMYSADYDLMLVNGADTYMLGVVEYPEPSILDFEDDEDIKTMADLAGDYVVVDGTYKVKICGFPAVWIDIHDVEDEASVGAYLYISTDTNMYYLMYVDIESNYQAFLDLVATITIGGVKEGTDLSAIE